MTDKRTVTGERLRLGGGFSAEEREVIVGRMASLDRRLGTYAIEDIDLELSVKDRDTSSQRVVLECWVAGWPRTVATSTRLDVDEAINEVRDDLVRQLNDQKTRTEPRNNRARRTV